MPWCPASHAPCRAWATRGDRLPRGPLPAPSSIAPGTAPACTPAAARPGACGVCAVGQLFSPTGEGARVACPPFAGQCAALAGPRENATRLARLARHGSLVSCLLRCLRPNKGTGRSKMSKMFQLCNIGKQMKRPVCLLGPQRSDKKCITF